MSFFSRFFKRTPVKQEPVTKQELPPWVIERLHKMEKRISKLTIHAWTLKEAMRMLKVLGADRQLPGFEATLADLEKTLADHSF